MNNKNQIIHKTILNWRFYVGFPFLMMSLVAVVLLEFIGMPCEFIYRTTKKWSESINYNKRLRQLTKWTFSK